MVSLLDAINLDSVCTRPRAVCTRRVTNPDEISMYSPEQTIYGQQQRAGHAISPGELKKSGSYGCDSGDSERFTRMYRYIEHFL